MKCISLDKNCKRTDRKAIHITHNDADALGCALSLDVLIPDYKFTHYFCNANEADAVFKDIFDESEDYAYIIISDISISLESAEVISEYQKKHDTYIHMVDHHPTNPCKHVEWMTFVTTEYYAKYDMGLNVSACYGIYELFSGRKLSLLVNHGITESDSYELTKIKCLGLLIESISRYDTWEWKEHGLPHDDAIPNIIKFIGFEFTYRSLYEYYIYNEKTAGRILLENYRMVTPMPEQFYAIYDVISLNKTLSIQKSLLNVRCFKFMIYDAAIFYGNSLYDNEISDKICNEFPSIDIAIMLYPESMTVSFRTSKEDINVGLIAKKLGGGGHQKASGAKLDTVSTMMSFIRNYYDAIPISEYNNSKEKE